MYYRAKYRLFRREKRPHDGRRGLIMLQIDALAYSDLRRAIDRGYCPTIKKLLADDTFDLRRWFCGLPSATPYCQAGIFHGENSGIPAFRFYDKPARSIVTCNAPQGVQYIRDRIDAQGALYGGSSYVNLLDGDARTVALQDVSLDLTQGEMNLLMGPSGSGKSTLLAVLSALLRPDAGDVRFDGKGIVGVSPDRLVRHGIVRSFQSWKRRPAATSIISYL